MEMRYGQAAVRWQCALKSAVRSACRPYPKRNDCSCLPPPEQRCAMGLVMSRCGSKSTTASAAWITLPVRSRSSPRLAAKVASRCGELPPSATSNCASAPRLTRRAFLHRPKCELDAPVDPKGRIALLLLDTELCSPWRGPLPQLHRSWPVRRAANFAPCAWLSQHAPVGSSLSTLRRFGSAEEAAAAFAFQVRIITSEYCGTRLPYLNGRLAALDCIGRSSRLHAANSPC